MSESLSPFVNAARQGDALTQNGAVTNSTSLNACVDLFFLAGASRNMPEADIIRVFTKAQVEDKQLAYKCLFWARDVRGGAGERRFFQLLMKHLRAQYNADWKFLYQHIPEYGYWKDFFLMTPNKELIEFVIEKLQKNDGLCAKWMPRKGDWFNAVRRVMNVPPKTLRQLIVSNTKVVEQQMCANKWDQINFSHVPSLAFKLYKKAFDRHDHNRFQMFIAAAVKGEVKVNAAAIFPYQLYQSWKKGDDANAIIAQWQNLKNYVTGDNSFLPVCDVSGSMTGLPMEISVSLGVYLSERNQSVFKDAFVTFSGRPTLEYLKGNVVERFRQLKRAHWEMNTNLQAVFTLILNTAIKNKLEEQHLPRTVIIISDMEFDRCCNGLDSFTAIANQYASAGYTMPRLVFWNVNGRVGNVPVSAKQTGVALVSGASPAIMQSVLEGRDFTPRGIMLHTLSGERYARIQVE